MLPRRVGEGRRGSDFTGSSREGLLGRGLLGLSDLVGLGCDLRIHFLTTARPSCPRDPTLRSACSQFSSWLLQKDQSGYAGTNQREGKSGFSSHIPLAF